MRQKFARTVCEHSERWHSAALLAGMLCIIAGISIQGCQTCVDEEINPGDSAQYYKPNTKGELYLNGQHFKKLTKDQVDASGLRAVYLDHNNFRDLPSFLTATEGIEVLSMQDNCLTHIEADFRKLKYLRVLLLAGNKIRRLPIAFGQLKELRTLQLGHRGIAGKGNRFAVFPEALRPLTRLETLDLSNNPLSDVPDWACEQLSGLRSLYLEDCNLRSLPQSFGKLHKLETLSLRSNRLLVLPAEFWDLDSLEKIDLGDNLLSEIPSDINQLQELKVLFLDHNRFSRLPNEIHSLSHTLRVLSLTGNPIDDAEIKRIKELLPNTLIEYLPDQ